MTKKVVGVYDNQTELIDAIEEYKNNGSSVQDFSIIGDTSDFSSTLESRTGVTTENLDANDTADKRDEGFWQSLMTAFNADNNLGGNSPDLSDRLVGLGLTEDAAREYEEDVRNGRIILLADSNASAVTDGGYSVEETGYVTDTSVTGTGARNYGTDNRDYDIEDRGYDNADNGTDEQTLKLREEELDVSKETVQSGEVEVRKEVVEDQKTVNIPVTREEVYVERRDVNEAVTGDDSTIDDDETIRVPIMEEKVEVTKKPVVKEELVVGKHEVTDTEQVVENVKHEEAHLDSDNERSVRGTDLDRDGFKDK